MYRVLGLQVDSENHSDLEPSELEEVDGDDEYQHNFLYTCTVCIPSHNRLDVRYIQRTTVAPTLSIFLYL